MNSENYSCYNLDYMCNQYISNQMDCEKSDCFFNQSPLDALQQNYDSILSTEQNTPERLYHIESMQVSSDFPCFTQNKVWMLFSDNNKKTIGQIQLKGEFRLPQLSRNNSSVQQKAEDSETKIPNQCQKCQRVFSTFRGLGGHVSRVHKNSSTKYIQKMETYNRRKQARENKSKLQAMIQNYKANMKIQ